MEIRALRGNAALGEKAFPPSVVRRAIFRGRIFAARRLRVRREPAANKSPRGCGFGGVFGRERPVVAFALDARFFFAKLRELENGAFLSRERGVPAGPIFEIPQTKKTP